MSLASIQLFLRCGEWVKEIGKYKLFPLGMRANSKRGPKCHEFKTQTVLFDCNSHIFSK